MKKVIYATLLLVAVLITSCSKEVRINRKLDGEWKVTSIDGESLTEGYGFNFTFEKDGKEGKGSLQNVYGAESVTVPFTYTLNDDKLTLVMTSGTETETEVLTINTYESKKIEMTDSENQKIVMEPK
jgi:hypothetical protein